MNHLISRPTTTLLSLLMVASVGCGGGDNAALGESNSDSNSSTNSDPANSGVNNGAANAATNNNTAPNGTTNNDVRDPRGDISFARPEGPTAYTNGTLVVEIAKAGEAADAELVLDQSEVLTEFGDDSLYSWDTSTFDEGSYELAVRFFLGDAQRWSFDSKTVIVDRRAPQLSRTSPNDGESLSRKDVPISLTFDEALDVDTVTPTSVVLTFDNGQTTPYTTALSADGREITVEFDRDAIATPYDAQILLQGVTDLAGNAAQVGLDYSVKAWRPELLAADLDHLEYLHIDGQEFLIGVAQARPNDFLRIYKGGAGWSEVVSEPMDQVYDIDVDVEGGSAHIAVLHRGSPQGQIVKVASLFEFDPTTETLSAGGEKVVDVDGGGGAIALDVRRMTRGTAEAVATVSGGRLRVYESTNLRFDLQSINTFPTLDHNFVRGENVEVHVKASGDPEVVFTRCESAAEPCYRTRVLRVTNTDGTWASAGTALTPTSNTSGDCDEFENFETIWHGDVPKMLMSYYGPCGTGSPFVMAREATASAWTSFAVGIMNHPSLANNVRYSSHVAIDPAGQIFGLVASTTQLMVTEFGATLSWFPEVGQGLDTRGVSDRISGARLFIDVNGDPIVIFQHQENVRVYRRN